MPLNYSEIFNQCSKMESLFESTSQSSIYILDSTITANNREFQHSTFIIDHSNQIKSF